MSREADSTTPSLGVHEVSKSYRGREVLHAVNLEFGPGVSVLLGRNGAGKSTLVRTLVGAELPTSGDVSLLHRKRRLAGAEFARQVGWLPQRFGFPGAMRVDDFLAYAAWLKGLARGAAREAAARAAEADGLVELRSARLRELSGGTLRRVGLAAALVANPTAVVLDEPTAGLDPVQRDRFHARIRSLRGDRCVIVATHLLEDIVALAEFIVVIDAGEVVWTGPRDAFAVVGAHEKDELTAFGARVRELIGSGE